MRRPPVRTIGLTGALTGAIALAVAHGSETFGELVPCALCLWERWPYRIAALCGVAAAFLPGPAARAMAATTNESSPPETSATNAPSFGAFGKIMPPAKASRGVFQAVQGFAREQSPMRRASNEKEKGS